MVSKVFIIAAVIAYVEARFGQEQVPIAAISGVQGGAGGAAATIAGAAISDLLGAANSCDKLVRADQIFTELGGGADALAAAIGMVTAEKNTNPFANGNVQNVCGDASLPVTPELRGITPLIDPAVDVNGEAAALSASSAANPLAADGLSVFDLMDQAGLGNLVASQASAGGAGGAAAGGAAAAGNNNNAAAGNNNAAAGNGNAANNANAGNNNNGAAADNQAATGDNAAACDSNAAAGNGNAAAGNGNAANNNNAGNQNNNNNNNANEDAAEDNAGNNQQNNQQNNANAGNQNNNNANAGNQNNNNNAGAGAGAGAGAAAGGEDFGLCTPTITFQGGENGRPADEFTFQIADPLARGGQGEALNPDIITNALCNQLTNVCEANAAAVAKCESAAAAVKGGTRNKALADEFNSLIGFPGAVTNPDGGPEDVAAAKRSMRRGLRL
ncbi:hypothetical protein COCCADRAFT_38307 [Bipolaris zeicola 26-R-13]|uniref:Circumsporozoite protein n=1 Tax=Cochliobolus carbonum (strain 26-R-13) TaxID=930089 RepID=W6Y0W8_COCC2|nr:uncharacterized protein COCCADRAFT_38307 [Bipolaris zeicola 26-R-13]EUC31623.1 hypothetical protein COCCADRAFT_38307 [Bipolaris zeicola 26-R-13]